MTPDELADYRIYKARKRLGSQTPEGGFGRVARQFNMSPHQAAAAFHRHTERVRNASDEALAKVFASLRATESKPRKRK